MWVCFPKLPQCLHSYEIWHTYSWGFYVDFCYSDFLLNIFKGANQVSGTWWCSLSMLWYMQYLCLLHVPVQEMLCYQHLWVNLFCIHNIKASEAYFFPYHEEISLQCVTLSHSKQCFVWSKVFVLFFEQLLWHRNHTVLRFMMVLAGCCRFKYISPRYAVHSHAYLTYEQDFITLTQLVRRSNRVYIAE
jgi:hypothetical protein